MITLGLLKKVYMNYCNEFSIGFKSLVSDFLKMVNMNYYIEFSIGFKYLVSDFNKRFTWIKEMNTLLVSNAQFQIL